MFEWKNLELSPQDYQNYVNNEDETQMRINNSNINAFEWSKLYQQIQVKSLNNRKLKKYILTYENNLRRLFGRDGISKEMSSMYAKHNNELRMQLSELYDQLGLMHVRNISTTVEFTISRLLGLEEEMIKTLAMKQAEVDQLQAAKNSLEMGKSSQLCTSCYEEMEKNRNKFLIKQVMAVEQSAEEMEELQAQELTQPQKEEKKLKEQSKKQDHQYEIQRFYYLNSVQQVLKNRQKTLKCNSAPLQTLLSQYLSQILEMLEGSKFTFTPKNLREYDRVNKSYESLDDMKALINADEFYKKVTFLIQKPYQNLIENIEKYINKSTNKSLVKTTTVQTQTLYLSEYNQIKLLEKKLTELHSELESLRHTKNKNDIDLIGNLQALHKIEIKYMEVSNRNKILQAENKRLENNIVQLKTQVVGLEERHRNDQSRLIDTNVAEKSSYIRDIKVLQARLKRYESMASMRVDIEVQTDDQNSQIISKELLENADKEYKKMIDRRQSKKQRKRMSLKMEEIKMLKQAQINRFQAEKLDVPDITLWRSKDNQLADNNQANSRSNERTKTIKIYTISPLQPLNDKLIHRTSSRKVSNARMKESQGSKREAASIVRISSPRADIKKMKRRHESKLKHGYHSSEFASNQNHYDKRGSNASKLSAITGKKIVRQDSIRINDRSEFESQVIIQYGDQVISKEQSVQYLSGSDEGKIIVTINQPTQQIPEDQRISAWLERQEPLLQPKKQEEINKLVKFSLKNFDTLLEKNIFGMICDMKFDKNLKTTIKRQQKSKDSSQAKQSSQAEPTVDVECSKIGRRCLQIFFNMQQAEKYETKTGIWSQIDTFIMVDNNFSHLCDKIQIFFDDLKELKPMLYQQSILFLEKPYYFCQEVEGKDYETKQITIFRQSLKSFELERNWIKKLFKRLLRLHKLVHKNCHHVQKFLEIIGFNKE